MGLFPLKGKTGFVGRSRRSLAELQDLGRAATMSGLRTLSKLTQTPVETGIPRIALVPRQEVGAVLQRHAPVAVGSRFPFKGTAPGAVASLFDKKNGLALVDLLMGQPNGTAKTFDRLEESALAEMTNIALNGAITAVASGEGVHFDTGVPDVAYKVADLGDFLAFDAPSSVDHAVVIETPFTEPTRGIQGVFILVFGIERLDEP